MNADSEQNNGDDDEIMKASKSAFHLIFRLFYPVYYFLTIPLRIFNWFFTNFPILSSFSLFLFVSFLLILLFLFRRLSNTPRENFISYILYTVIPYGISIVYTAVGFIFPQVQIVSRIVSLLLHPIKFILGFIEKVDKRAEPIRRTVEAFHGSKKSKNARRSTQEELNDSRLQCCICQFEEKRILLRPCNHVCLCQRCNNALQQQENAACPICRTKIESFDTIFLS